jgi:hypothetical protein
LFLFPNLNRKIRRYYTWIQISKYVSHLAAVHGGKMIRRNLLLFPPPQNEGSWSARIDVVRPVSKHLSNIWAAVEEAVPLTFRNRYTQNYSPLRNNWLCSSSCFYQLYRIKFKLFEEYKFTGRSS